MKKEKLFDFIMACLIGTGISTILSLIITAIFPVFDFRIILLSAMGAVLFCNLLIHLTKE